MADGDLIAILPELFLAIAGMALLMLGVFRGASSTAPVLNLSVVALAIAGAFILVPERTAQSAFSGLFIVDAFGDFMKILVLIGSALTMAMSLRFIEQEQMARFEFPVLLVFATLGMLMMISANDLIALYLGLELQSLSLYVVAAFRRDNPRSSEAGLKYFVLGALSSGMLLYGSSMVYGFAGTTNFDALAQVLGTGQETPATGLVIGLVFVIAGLAFKVSAVPFHMWTPDVYEGAPTPVTAFFANAPQIAAMALLVRVLLEPFGHLHDQWRQVIVFVSIASMVLGALAAMGQKNIKRLMAYGSIGHIGYALVGLVAGSEAGVRGIGIYLAIYLAMNIGTFACILCMRQKDRMVEGIDDLRGLSRTSPMMALALAIFMFSMAGMPPLAGFFGKLHIFLAAIAAELYTLAIVGVLSSVVAAFYYLRIVKIMYFEEPEDSFDRPLGREMGLILTGTAIVIAFFVLMPSPILDGAEAAAAALFAD